MSYGNSKEANNLSHKYIIIEQARIFNMSLRGTEE